MTSNLELATSVLMWASMLVGSIAMLVHALRRKPLDGPFPLYPTRLRRWLVGESGKGAK